MHCAAHGRAPAAATNPPLSPSVPGVWARSLAGTLRMTQLHPPMQRSDTAIAGRLVKHRIALCRTGKRLGVTVLFDLERVEAGAQHEHELVAQHLTGGAQFTFITVTFAQQPRLAIGAAIAERGKYQRHRGYAIE